MNINLARIEGKVFSSPITGQVYGIVRPLRGRTPPDFALDNEWSPFAEDESGNYFAISSMDAIGFWDHETATIVIIADTINSFYDGCIAAGDTELNPEQIKSTWVDPKFAKQVRMKNVPKDGWIKKKA